MTMRGSPQTGMSPSLLFEPGGLGERLQENVQGFASELREIDLEVVPAARAGVAKGVDHHVQHFVVVHRNAEDDAIALRRPRLFL